MHVPIQFPGHRLLVEAQCGDGLPLAFMQDVMYQVVKISRNSPYISKRRKQTESYTLHWLYWRFFPSMRFLHCFGSTEFAHESRLPCRRLRAIIGAR